MRKCVTSLVTMIFLLSIGGTSYADIDDNQSDYNAVIQDITEIQTTDPSLPIGVPEPKGKIGFIISKLFNTDGRISNKVLKSIGTTSRTTSNNKLLRWSGTEGGYFVDSIIYDTGTQVGIGATPTVGSLKLDVAGSVGASEYCDENGLNCFSPSAVSTGGGTVGGTGTAGYVTKFTAASTIGDSIIRDNGSQIGIGISPSAQLHTSGIGRFDGGVSIDGKSAISGTNISHTARNTSDSNYGYFEVRNNSNTRGAYFGWGNGSGTVDLNLETANFLDITGGQVILGTEGTEADHLVTKGYVDSTAGTAGGLWTATGSNIYRDTGNVGIGVSTPGVKLDVVGDIRGYNVATNCVGAGCATTTTPPASGNWEVNGNLSILGTTTLSGAVTANGGVNSTLYCDENGNNCKTMEELVNSGGVKIRAMFDNTGYANHYCAISTKDELYCRGSNSYGANGTGVSGTDYVTAKVPLTDVNKVYAAINNTCALQNDGDVYCWGYNGNRNLGDGTTTHRNAPDHLVISGIVDVSMTQNNVCALKTDGTVWCWGYGAYGQNGNSASSAQGSPVQVTGLTGISNIESSQDNYRGTYDFICAHKTDGGTTGSIWCWGYSGYGTLGDGTTTSRNYPVQFGSHSDYTKIFVGEGYAGSTCGIRTNGELWCAGYNRSGTLGVTGSTARKSPVLTSAGNDVADMAMSKTTYASHACVLKTGGTVWCTGRDRYGNLGDGTANNTVYYAYQQVIGLSNIEKVKISDNAHSDQGAFTCAKDTSGNLYCWGYGGHCNLGASYSCLANNPTPQLVSTIAGRVSDFYMVGGGHYGVCAILTDGSLTCWGHDGYRRTATGNDGIGTYAKYPYTIRF